MCQSTHFTLHFTRGDALLDWHSVSRHEVARGFDLIPGFGVQFLQEMDMVIISCVMICQADDEIGKGLGIVKM